MLIHVYIKHSMKYYSSNHKTNNINNDNTPKQQVPYLSFPEGNIVRSPLPNPLNLIPTPQNPQVQK